MKVFLSCDEEVVMEFCDKSTPLYTSKPVEPPESKAAPLVGPMRILTLPLETGFGLGAHASSVLRVTTTTSFALVLRSSID